MSKSHHILTALPSFVQGIVVVYYQSRQAMKEEGLKGIFRPRFFWKRKATPVEMDLSIIPSPANLLRDARYQFIELKWEDLLDGNLLFVLPSRGRKAPRNLKRGWRGFALVNGNEVVGDVWCITPVKSGRAVTHPDLKMLGITCSDNDAYAFDMYISPAHRGENLAAPFNACSRQS